jgi:phosphate-selective porin OprO/OprP
VGAALVLALARCASASEATAYAPSAAPFAQGNPLRLEREVRVTVDTNAAPGGVGSTNAPGKSRHLTASWRGWNGLYLELDERTPLTNPTNLLGGYVAGANAPLPLQLEQVKLAAHVGARIEVDGAVFATSGNLTGFDDSVQLRRAFINVDGDCILMLPVSYLLQLGYIPGSFFLNQAYLLSPTVNYVGAIQFGVYGPPMGLDLVANSRDITFMEPAAVLQALGPPNLLGVQVGHPVFNQRATWALGLFGAADESAQYGNASQNFGSIVGRVTWLALDHLAPERPAENHLLHLGLSANYQYSPGSDVRYQSRPESYIAPLVIDTGNLAASQATVLGLEAAYVNGPFSVQGEFLHSFVLPNAGARLSFGGCYAEASWYLTGESRPYDPVAGCFSRLFPNHNFNWGRGGAWGAWELAARVSYTDLDSGTVQGGKLSLLFGGVNWYLTPHVRWMFNCGVGRVSGGLQDGDLFIAQTRVGVDF